MMSFDVLTWASRGSACPIEKQTVAGSRFLPFRSVTSGPKETTACNDLSLVIQARHYLVSFSRYKVIITRNKLFLPCVSFSCFFSVLVNFPSEHPKNTFLNKRYIFPPP